MVRMMLAFPQSSLIKYKSSSFCRFVFCHCVLLFCHCFFPTLEMLWPIDSLNDELALDIRIHGSKEIYFVQYTSWCVTDDQIRIVTLEELESVLHTLYLDCKVIQRTENEYHGTRKKMELWQKNRQKQKWKAWKTLPHAMFRR